MSFFKRSLLLLLVLFSAQNVSFAGEVPTCTKRICGLNNYPVQPGMPSASDSVQLAGMPLGFPLSYSDRSVTNVLSFGINANSPVVESDSMNIRIRVHLHCYNSSMSCMKDTCFNMCINYHPGDTAAEIGRSTLIREGAYKMKFTIDSIYVNGIAKQTLPRNVFLEGSISAKRSVDFSGNVDTQIVLNPIDSLNTDCDPNGTTDELMVSWPVLAGAEEYQLEWTYINDYPAAVTANYKNPSTLPYDFRNNSTRITTTNTYYKVPVLFEHGYVLFRVRALGFDLNSPPNILSGAWSAGDNGMVSTHANRYYVWNPHEANKNWQLTTTFAEEGKKKEVISYFDGSQRNRQSVTKINSDNNAIIGETIYDFEGRPAVNVLPTPVVFPTCSDPNVSAVIKYYENYNKGVSTKEYSAVDFDSDIANNTCGVSTGPMIDVSGSSQYYSTNNPDKNGAQAFVPDAQQYPFSQVEYAPDNTGRIRKQGGVGPEYQLGSTHETKYYYGQPNQLQLDRMFGSEVGDALHYKKDLVIDANGQVSVTYLDQEGRTVATSLASTTPGNVSTIPSGLAPATSLTVDLFNKDANGISSLNIADIPTHSITFNSQLLVSNQSVYTFDYTMSIDTLSDSCLAQGICFSCVYDLEIKVIDECGVNVTPQGAATHVGHFTPPANPGEPIQFITTCTTPTTYSTSVHSVTGSLPVGNYNVVKTLTLNSDAIDFYVNAYLDSTINTCYKTLHDFQQGAFDSIDFSGCEMDCDKCLQQLGSKDDFVAQGEGTAADYDREFEECKSLCPAPVDPCEVAYEAMLGDVSPEGQYGETEDTQGTFNPGNFPLSVFNETNKLPVNITTATGNWRNPKITLNGTTYLKYIEDDFTDAIVEVAIDPNNSGHYIPDVNNPNTNVLTDPNTGQLFTYPQYLTNVTDFVTNFKPSWAKSLIAYHPEYSYYLDCISYKEYCPGITTTTSYRFDSLLMITNTFQDAVTRNLISSSWLSTSVGTNAKVSDWDVQSASHPWDPYAANPSNCYPGGTFLAGKFNHYITVAGISRSMAEMASMSARYSSQVNGTPQNNTNGGWFDKFGQDEYSTGPNLAQRNDAVRDNEWRLLKGFYLAEKQRLQINASDNNALFNSHTLNDCIGNSNFSPVASGMINSFPSSQFSNSSQPCSFSNLAYYANKQQRFPDPSEVLVNDPNQAAYQLYLQTGQCPNTMNFQQLLGAIAAQQDLDNTNLDLRAVGVYNALYQSLGGPAAPTPTLPATWSASAGTNSLTLTINDQNLTQLQNCTTTLISSAAGFTAWDDIQNFYNLQATTVSGGVFGFTVQAMVTVLDANNLPVLQPMTFTGSTCFDIHNCSFPTTCSGNQLAKDISLLMSVLSSGNNLLSTSAVNLQVTAYQGLLSNSIKNKVAAQPGSQLSWIRISSSPYTFELYDANNVTPKKIRIEFSSVNPNGTVTVASLLTPVQPSFTNMVSGGGQNYFDVDAVDVNGNITGNIHGKVTLVDGSTEIGIAMGTCGYPESMQCTQDGHKVRKDLDDLLHDVLAPGFDPNASINVFASSFFTPLLQSYFAQTATSSTSSYSVSVITDGQGNVTGNRYDLTTSIDGCTISLNYTDNNAPALPPSDLVSLGNIEATGLADAEGNLHDFIMKAHFNGGDVDIHGTSCLPLLNCQQCLTVPVYPEPTTSSQKTGQNNSTMTTLSPCEILYNQYLAVTQAYNASHVPACPNLTILSFADFSGRNYCCRDNAYEIFIEYVTKVPGQGQNSQNCAVDISNVPEKDCTPGFDLQATDCAHKNRTNTVAYLTSLFLASQYHSDFPQYGLGNFANNCNCLYAYYNYVLPYLAPNYDPTLPPLQKIDQFCDPCVAAYTDYSNAVNAYNTYQAAHPNLPVLSPVYTQAQLSVNKYCTCVSGFVTNVNAIVTGNYNNSSPSVILQLIDLSLICNPPPPPCTPDGIPPFTPTGAPPPSDPCHDQLVDIAMANAQAAYEAYKDSIVNYIRNKYIAHCMGAVENFTMKYDDKEYHFTLYYYDQAGNLIKTIPPEGIRFLDVNSDPLSSGYANKQLINADRTFGTRTIYTSHTMATTYEYNSLNQLVTQYMPDHDPMDVFDITLPNGLDSRLQTTAIQMVDNNRGYLTGYIPVTMPQTNLVRNRGYLYNTYDGGATWQKAYSLVASDLKKVFMVDNTTGYAVGSGGVVLKTEDGGNTWDMLYTYDNNGLIYDLNDLHFTDVNNGIVIGKGGKILHTTDGGVTFTDHYINSWSGVAPADISLNGVTFTALNGGLYYITASALVNGNNVGAIFRSANGNTWTQEDQIISPTLNDVYYFNTDSAYAVGEDGILLYTANNGTNWTVIETGLARSISKVFFKNRYEGIVLADSTTNFRQVWSTSDAGHTWTLFSKPGNYYNDIYEYYHRPYGTLIPATTGYGCKLFAVGKKGLLQKIILMNNTPNGFVDIAPPSSLPAGFEFTAAWAAPNSAGYTQLLAAGSNGSFYFARDYSGPTLSWFSQSVTGFSASNAIQVKAYQQYSNSATNCRGVVLQANGAISELKFTTAVYPPVITATTIPGIPVTPLSVFKDLALDSSGTTSSIVYGVNNTNARLRIITLPFNHATALTNAQPAGTLTSNNIFGLDVRNNKLIAAGLNGVINTRILPVPTNWTDRSLNNTPPGLYDIAFDPSSFLLYAVGGDGTIIRRTTGQLNPPTSNNNWQVLKTGTAEKLNRILFTNLNQSIVIGNKGLMLDGSLSQFAYTATKKNTGTNNNLNDILKAGNTVVLAGDNGSILFTTSYNLLPFTNTNQGTSANFYGLAVKPGTASVLAFGDKNLVHLCAATSYAVVKSIYPDKLVDVHFADAHNGMVIGAPFTIRHSTDGAASFSIVLPDNNNPNTVNGLSVPNNVYNPGNPNNVKALTKVWMVNPNYALVIGTVDRYIATVENNIIQQQDPNLIPVAQNVGRQLKAIHFGKNNPLTGYVGGDRRKIRQITLTPNGNSFTITLNNGIVQPPTPPGGNAFITDLQVLDNGNVMAVGEAGLVKMYTSSGWVASSAISLPATLTGTVDLNTVYFHDNNYGYAAGTNGMFLKIKIKYVSGTVNAITATQRSLADNLNISAGNSNLTSPVVNAIAFATPTDGIFGGNYGTYSNTSAYPYARLLHDELERFSTRFYYDRLGRMVLSQNTKQYNKATRAFSYTIYDALGRISEVGEKAENNGTNAPKLQSIFGTMVSSYFNPKVIDDANLLAWVSSNGLRSEVTHTFYDETTPALAPNVSIVQENLRKRVASVTFEDVYDNNAATYQHATHYSYDIHGNVKTLDNENQKLATNYPDGTVSTTFAPQKHKITDYDYDLISGKVNSVAYQAGEMDEWRHRYTYDADNRIVQTETSTDDVLWQTDSKYFYYKHGPLARTEIGENQVQGCDYVYTLQGWIKGVNSNSLATANDPGKDNDQYGTGTSVNENFAKDIYGYTLGYHSGEYTPIDLTKWTNPAVRFEAVTAGSQLENARKDFFNGNISHMVTTIVDPNQSNLPMVLGSAYQYDQLNRLALGTSYTNLNDPTAAVDPNTWQAGTGLSNTYKNEFTYDANGNILNQKRRNQNGLQFDDLSYVYQRENLLTGNMVRNRLYHVNDGPATLTVTDDIEDQGSLAGLTTAAGFGPQTNYDYTAIGELKKDAAEHITNIEWSVYGKVKEVTRMVGNTERTLKFDYDAMGNRVAKHNFTSNGVWSKSTYYSRDAQGNVLSVYEQKVVPSASAVSYAQIEKHIYGSSRLGMERTFTELMNNGGGSGGGTERAIIIDAPGARVYELTNHLGNVLSVITDRKIPETDALDHVIAYHAEVIVSNDYSAFGAPLQGRTFNKQVCTVTTNTVTTTLLSDNFASGTAGNTPLNTNTTVNNVAGKLRVGKIVTVPGTVTIGDYKDFAAAAGASYVLTFDYSNVTLSSNPVASVTEIGNPTHTSTATLTTNGTYTLNITAGAAANYRIQYTATANGKRSFDIDNVVLTQTAVNTNSVCTNYDDYRYGFNGQEKDDEMKGDGNSYGYDARILDTRLGRWLSADPERKIYTSYSPYLFAANCPINAVDQSGKLIIFINGMWGSVFNLPSPNEGYWNHGHSDWVSNLKTHWNDYATPMFFDGAIGGQNNIQNNFDKDTRMAAGKLAGKENAKTIIDNLTAGETIKFVTNSMGAAYQRGFSEGLYEFISARKSANLKEQKDLLASLDYIDKEMAAAEEGIFSTGLDGKPVDLEQLKNLYNNNLQKVKSLQAEHRKLEGITTEIVVDIEPFQSTNADINAKKHYYTISDKSNYHWAENLLDIQPVEGATDASLTPEGKATSTGHNNMWTDPFDLPKN